MVGVDAHLGVSLRTSSSFRGEAQVQDVRGAKIEMPTGNPNSQDYADEIAKNCFVWCGLSYLRIVFHQ